jgi:hypothetical protein
LPTEGREAAGLPTIVVAGLDIGGNVPPMIGIARELARRGWRVLVHGDDLLRQRIEDAGLTFVPTHARQIDLLHRWTSPSDLAGLLRFLKDGDRPKEVLALVRAVGADVALVDVSLPLVAAACTGKLPTAVLVHTM